MARPGAGLRCRKLLHHLGRRLNRACHRDADGIEKSRARNLDGLIRNRRLMNEFSERCYGSHISVLSVLIQSKSVLSAFISGGKVLVFNSGNFGNYGDFGNLDYAFGFGR